MPLYRRLPKRGFNSIRKENIAILNIQKLQLYISNNKLDNNNLINLTELKKKKHFKRKDK